MPGDVGHLDSRFDRGHVAPELRERSGRLPGAASDLEYRRRRIHTRHCDEISEEFVRVRRSNPLVDRGYLVEELAALT